MALAAFLPFLLSLGLVFFLAYGWRHERKNLEEIRRRRALSHTAERAQLAAKHFQGFQKVKLTGILPEGGTMLIGYRRDNDSSDSIFPGERIIGGGRREGTLITWVSGKNNLGIDTLYGWCSDENEVFLRVTESGKMLVLSEPRSGTTLNIPLMPSKT